MQHPAGIDQRREPAASDRAAAVLAGIVDRVLFERPETGYRVLRVRARGRARSRGGGRRPAAGRARRADPRRGRLVRRPHLGSPVPRHHRELRGPGQRGRAGGLPGIRPDQGHGRGAGAAAGRASSASRLGEIIEHEPLRLRDVEGVGPKLASRLQEAWQGHRRARDTLVFLAEQGLQPGARQPGPGSLRHRRDRDHQPRPLRAGPRHPRHRLRHRRRDRTQARRRPGFGAAGRGGAWPRCCARPPTTATPRCRWPRRRTPARRAAARQRPSAVTDAIERELRAGRLVELADDGDRYLMLAELDRAEAAIADRHLARSPQARRPGRCRIRDGAIARSEAALRHGPGPQPARGDRARHPQQAAGDHRRPGHRQDDAGARHPGRPRRRRPARRCWPPRPAARRDAWPRAPGARRARCTACSRPTPSAASAATTAGRSRPIW